MLNLDIQEIKCEDISENTFYPFDYQSGLEVEETDGGDIVVKKMLPFMCSGVIKLDSDMGILHCE